MQPLYLKRNEVSTLLGMPEKKAVELLANYGILPVDLGKGRGNGLRWRTSAVIQAADTLHAETQRPRRPHARTKTQTCHPLLGKSAKELDAEFKCEVPLQ